MSQSKKEINPLACFQAVVQAGSCAACDCRQLSVAGDQANGIVGDCHSKVNQVGYKRRLDENLSPWSLANRGSNPPDSCLGC
jgi:hypothetical protein